MSDPGDDTSPPPPEPSSPAAETGSIGRPFGESEPILPAAVSEDALPEAVGVHPRKRKVRRQTEPDSAELDEDGNPIQKSRKLMMIVVGSIVGGAAIAGLVLLGRVNGERYVLDCTTKAAVAEQGRAFPPWGEKPLLGAEWKPIPLPANAQCKTEEVADRATLEAKFLDMLLERASAALTAHDFPEAVAGEGRATTLDAISAQLEQALLLSRAPERGDQRKQIERLQGDVQYWRASLRLRDASNALTEAAKQFDAAALQRPMHVSDAGAWAELLRRITDELHAGPGGVPATLPAAATGETHPPAPQGTALPVEPEPQGSDTSAAVPDAGLPTGGVLL